MLSLSLDPSLQLAAATLSHTFLSSGDYSEGNAFLHIFLVLRKQLCAINKGCTHIRKTQKHTHENIRNRDCDLDSAEIELCSIIQISLAQDCHPLFVGWCRQQMWELYSTATYGLSVIMYSQTQKPHTYTHDFEFSGLVGHLILYQATGIANIHSANWTEKETSNLGPCSLQLLLLFLQRLLSYQTWLHFSGKETRNVLHLPWLCTWKDKKAKFWEFVTCTWLLLGGCEKLSLLSKCAGAKWRKMLPWSAIWEGGFPIHQESQAAILPSNHFARIFEGSPLATASSVSLKQTLHDDPLLILSWVNVTSMRTTNWTPWCGIAVQFPWSFHICPIRNHLFTTSMPSATP